MARILVVEDEAHLAEGLRFNLEAEGHEVEIARDGAAAARAAGATRGRFDLVILDLMLPEMSGFEVRAARARRGQLRADPDPHRQGRRAGPACAASRRAPTTT